MSADVPSPRSLPKEVLKDFFKFIAPPDLCILDCSRSMTGQEGEAESDLYPQEIFICQDCSPADHIQIADSDQARICADGQASHRPLALCTNCAMHCHLGNGHQRVQSIHGKHKTSCDCPETGNCKFLTPQDLRSEQIHQPPPNTYGHNYAYRFCDCDTTYDDENETDSMLQCRSCDDWYHTICLKLRSGLTSEQQTQAAVRSEAMQHLKIQRASEPLILDDDQTEPASETVQDEILQGPDDDDFAALGCVPSNIGFFVCSKCAQNKEILLRNLSQDGWNLAPGSAPKAPDQSESEEGSNGETALGTSTKRSRSASPDARVTKKSSVSVPPLPHPPTFKASQADERPADCTLPQMSPEVLDRLTDIRAGGSSRLDIFIEEGKEDDICQCEKVGAYHFCLAQRH